MALKLSTKDLLKVSILLLVDVSQMIVIYVVVLRLPSQLGVMLLINVVNIHQCIIRHISCILQCQHKSFCNRYF